MANLGRRCEYDARVKKPTSREAMAIGESGNTMPRVKKPTTRTAMAIGESGYDAKGNETYYETSTGYWSKRECDAKGKETYFEDSDGCKEGTPLSQSCDGKVIEVDGKKYKLTEL